MASRLIKDETEYGDANIISQVEQCPAQVCSYHKTHQCRMQQDTETEGTRLPAKSLNITLGSKMQSLTPQCTLPPLLGEAGDAPGMQAASAALGRRLGKDRDVYECFLERLRRQPAVLETVFPHRPTATSAHTAQSRLAARCELAAASAPKPHLRGATIAPQPTGNPRKPRGTRLPAPLPPAWQVSRIRALSCCPALRPKFCFGKGS